MIAKLKGLLDRTEDHALIIDVNGVGYWLHCSDNTLKKLPPVGELVELEVETVLKQDSLMLYGFHHLDEKDSFRLLQRVQGVGARVALAILSVLTPEQIYTCIQQQDHTPITQAEGVGPKVAQRIVRELKDKLGDIQTATLSHAHASTFTTSPSTTEALSALLHLGYKRNEALEALHYVKQQAPDKQTTDTVLPLALKYLGTKLK